MRVGPGRIPVVVAWLFPPLTRNASAPSPRAMATSGTALAHADSAEFTDQIIEAIGRRP